MRPSVRCKVIEPPTNLGGFFSFFRSFFLRSHGDACGFNVGLFVFLVRRMLVLCVPLFCGLF